MNLRFLCSARLLRWVIYLPDAPPANVFRKSPGSRLIKPGLAVAMALLLLPPGRLFAQQGPQPWPTDEPDNGQYMGQYVGQYAPNPQPVYGQQQYGQPQYPQPQYGQPQAYAQQPYPGPTQGYPQQAYAQPQPLSADELQQLVAPIALYPDALLAQILAASTYPAQVAAADQWLRGMQAQGYASPDQIADGADSQSNWDPSVKALTAFPQVLALMDRNLQWTTNLGNAYYNDPQDVMQTVQVMRERAQDAGNLQTTPQEYVGSNQGYIDIAPANPQVVYVPSYNPWDVYGQPVSPYPGFSLLGALSSFFGSSPVQYGLGTAISAFTHTSWGWLGWGLDWLTHSVLFQHNNYMTQSTSVADWGFPHGGPRAYPGRSEMARTPNSYGGPRDNYPRQGYGYNRNPGQEYARSTLRYGDPRSAETFNRGDQRSGSVYGRPALPSQQAYNRYPQQPVARPQTYAPRSQSYAGTPQQYARSGYGSGSGYGYGFYNRTPENYGGRFGQTYGAPSQPYRSPESSYPRGDLGGRSNGAYGGAYGGSVARQENSGGFHLFGHGRESGNFNYGGRAPKSFNEGGHAPKGFGREKMPKGGHFGGGGHSGGGHSSGHGGFWHHH